MRIVVDTNVFVSGIFFGGPPGRVLTAWRDGTIKVVVSREIIEEYVRVGDELSARFPAVDLVPALHLIAAGATMVAAPPLPEPVCSDPDDDKFLACAVAAGAAYVVSGDRGLLAASPYEKVTVIRPRALVDTILQQEH